MVVRDILRGKGSEVFTIAPDARISELVRLLAERGIGAAVVKDGDGRVVGVISERDIVHCIAEHGADCLDHAVSELMTEKVVTCAPNTGIAEVMNQMTERRIRHLPVIENGRLAGLISIGDVVKHRIASAEREAEQLREYITT